MAAPPRTLGGASEPRVDVDAGAFLTNSPLLPLWPLQIEAARRVQAARELSSRSGVDGSAVLSAVLNGLDEAGIAGDDGDEEEGGVEEDAGGAMGGRRLLAAVRGDKSGAGGKAAAARKDKDSDKAASRKGDEKKGDAKRDGGKRDGRQLGAAPSLDLFPQPAAVKLSRPVSPPDQREPLADEAVDDTAWISSNKVCRPRGFRWKQHRELLPSPFPTHAAGGTGQHLVLQLARNTMV